MKYPFSTKQTLIGGGLSLLAFILYYGLWGRGTINKFIWELYYIHNQNKICLRAIEKHNQVVVDSWNQFYESEAKGAGREGIDMVIPKMEAAEKSMRMFCFDENQS